MKKLNFLNKFDWVLFLSTIPLLVAGLITMYSFSEGSVFFIKQIQWIVIAVSLFFLLVFIDLRFLRRTYVLVGIFVLMLLLLAILLITGQVFQGARSWFDLGIVSFQPSEIMKIVLILVLAKYFSRRHVEIANIKHIFISGIYALVPFLLIFFQPDFGTAVIIFLIWFGMVFASGISKKHLLIIFTLSALSSGILWGFVFEDYQKNRVLSFLDPYADIQGAGYNAHQSKIAVGSGELFGKGVGFGTQSRLEFLPEYHTDFIFAAFAEEWGFVGVLIIFLLFGIIFWRILANSITGASNFEALFGIGLAILFMSHFFIHIGTNIGLLPVTGTTIPFMSYGGSHMLTVFLGLGILMNMRGYSRRIHREDVKNEFIGI